MAGRIGCAMPLLAFSPPDPRRPAGWGPIMLTPAETRRRHDRRLYVMGLIGVLCAGVLVARSHLMVIDHEFSQTRPAGVRINVNTADAATLGLLRQIGPERARQIVAWREQNGPFRSYQELMQVSGIGSRTVQGLVEQVCFDDR